MVNRELLEYVQNQQQLGVSKEEIAKALFASGWPAEDVREALGVKPAAPAAAPSVNAKSAVVSDMVTNPPAVAPIRPAAAEAYFSARPGTPNVAPAANPTVIPATATPTRVPIQEATFVKRSAGGPAPATAAAAAPAGVGRMSGWKKWLIPAGIGLGGLVIGFAISFFFAGKGDLSDQVKSLQDDKDKLSLQISALAKDKDNLNNQMVALQAQAKDLRDEISILAAPNPDATSTVPVTVKGILRVDSRGQFRVETPNGFQIYVKNYKDALVVSALKPNVDKQIV
ncbi:MAG TPA: hypothetical protein VMC43_00120, partial [Candidatus Paceibacterota bacterium]|nr:hypothetical protein [Candidatus Paceibacterota bacterium]